MHPVVILNAGAGSVNGDRDAISTDAVREAFLAAGAEVTVQIAPPDRLAETLQAVTAQHPPAIFVGGGDGSISTAAAHLAETDIPLGVLPLGTLNHFARDLGIPLKWSDAVAALAHGTPRSVDVGEVNGHVFINNCSIGSYPEAVRTRERIRREQQRGKWIAMAIATLRVFRRLRRFRVRIETPDTRLVLRTPFVFIGNNRYSGHLLDQSLRARLDQAQLSIYTTHAQRRFTLLRLAWQSLVHSIDEADALETHFSPAATVTSLTGAPLPLAIDGELAHIDPPLRFRSRPGALRVLAPSPTPASASASTSSKSHATPLVDA